MARPSMYWPAALAAATHRIFLASNGIHILDNMNTDEMARPGSQARSRRSSIRSRSGDADRSERDILPSRSRWSRASKFVHLTQELAA